MIRGNYIHDYIGSPASSPALGKGIEVWYQTQNALIENNTITNMRTAGIGINDGSSNNTIRRNIISLTTGDGSASSGAGIIITSFDDSPPANPPPTGNVITQNAIYGNAGLGIDLDVRTGAYPNAFVGDGVTLNNNAKSATIANAGMDFPVFTSAALGGSTLTVSGYVGLGPNQATFAGAVIEIFKAAPGAGDTSGPNTYGEGQTYLGTLTADANGNFTGSLAASGLLAGDRITATARDASGNTSEFGVNYTVTATNSAPVAVNDTYTVTEDGALTVNWWDLNWTQRQQITFSGNTGAGTQTLTNFPVLVTLNSGNIDYTQTQNDGGDLRFFDPDGTPLAYEVERWDESGTSYVWVKVPQIDTTGTDFIRMYYGNAAAPDGQNPSAVWSGSGYSAVYHLDDGGPAIDDATANGFDGMALSGAANAQPGQIGLAYGFDGVNDYINLGANRSFIDGATAATFSAWVNPDDVTNPNIILSASIAGAPSSTSRMAIELDSGGVIKFIVRSGDGIDTTVFTTTGVTAGAWHYVTGVVDLATDAVTVYIDGTARVLIGAINLPAPAFPSAPSAGSSIGANDDGTGPYFDGRIDEARIATAARSAGWVLAEYRTMTNAFVTLGVAQPAPATGGVLDNDTDADGNSLTATLVSGPANGVLALSVDGTFTYTPNADFYGTDTFTYRANDGTVNSNVATVTITVTPVADIVNDATSTNEDTAVVLNVLTNDSFENAGRTVTSVTNGANGTVTIVNGALGTVQYTPNANFNGSDSFTYTVTSGGATETATVTVTVTPVNDAPTLATGSVLAYTENGAAAAINTVITTADLDNATLASGTVSITTNFASGQDVLGFANVPATMGTSPGPTTPAPAS